MRVDVSVMKDVRVVSRGSEAEAIIVFVIVSVLGVGV